MDKQAYTLGWHEAITKAAIERLRQQGYQIDPEHERRIIDANASTDLYALRNHYKPETKPFHYLKDRAPETRKVLSWLLQQAKTNDDYAALDALGIATHVAQDKYSHKELGVSTSNAWKLHFYPGQSINPDDPRHHPYLARKAVHRTERMIKHVLRARGGKLPAAPTPQTQIAYTPDMAAYKEKRASLLVWLAGDHDA